MVLIVVFTLVFGVAYFFKWRRDNERKKLKERISKLIEFKFSQKEVDLFNKLC